MEKANKTEKIIKCLNFMATNGILIDMMKKLSVKKAAALLAVLFIGFTMLTGCSWIFEPLLTVNVTGIRFKDSADWTMTLGEEKNITASEVEVMPSYATDKEFTITSSDSNVVTTSAVANRIRAVGIGNCTITVTSRSGNFSAIKAIDVTYAPLSNLTIAYDVDLYTVAASKIIMDDDNVLPITMHAQLSENSDPDTPLVWTLYKDELQILRQDIVGDEEFVMAPQLGTGIYTVILSAESGPSDKLEIYVCAPITDAALSYTGNLLQEEGVYSPVAFSFAYTNPTGNPNAVVEWTVNGEAVAQNTLQYSFTPKMAGKYTVNVFVNGRIAGSQTVVAKGSVRPQNVVVDFDNCYPKVFIRWDEIPSDVGYAVSIVNNTTGVEAANVNSNNLALRDKFSASGFDASDYMNTTAANIFNTSFTVKVKTLGDDGALTESQYSQPYTTPVVSDTARSYLSQTYYDGARNLYISSDEEFYDWFAYAMMWRYETTYEYAVSEHEDVLYMAFPYLGFGNRTESYFTDKAMDYITTAFDKTNYTGLYRYGGETEGYAAVGKGNASGSLLTVTLVSFADGTPSTRTQNNSPNAWNAIRPHVNYDDNKARPGSYVFPIDRKQKVTVSTSEQLYHVAQLGYNPQPATGSAAQRLYNYARRLLRNIVTDDMSDLEKAHAIYDWILWRVTYDEKVLNVKGTVNPDIDGTDSDKQDNADIRAAVQYEAYYLEGVLTDSDYYAVCDGMSKAYSLLCNIEGIPCIRISGYGVSEDEYGRPVQGGHAWNKVQIGGEWYMVDCTWGDMTMPMTSGISAPWKEVAFHAYFLLTDEQTEADHIEDDNYNYPRTAAEPLNWYDLDFDYEGKNIDRYLDTEAGLTEEVRVLTEYMVSNLPDAERQYAVGPDKNVAANRVSSLYYGYDIAVSASLNQRMQSVFEQKTMANPIVFALKTYCGLDYGRDYYYNTFTSYGNVYVLLFFTI